MIGPRTIGGRLGLFNAVLVLTALIGLGSAGLLAVDRVLVAGAERILMDEVLDVTRELEERPLAPDELETLLVREAAEEHVYDVHYRVTSLAGKTLASSSDPFWARIAWRPIDPEAEAFETVRLPNDPHRVRVATRVVDTPGGPVELEVALRLEPEDLAMARLLQGGVLAVPLVIAIAALLGLFMARRALAPVDAIERAARTIGAGPRGRRLPAAGTNDELDRLAATLNAMLDRLERAALRNLAFAGDVAHELRTPLAVLRARLEEALSAALGSAVGAPPGSGAERAEGAAAIERSMEAVARLELMVRSLLALARADEGGLAAAPASSFDLGDVASEVVAFFAPAAEARGMNIELHREPGAHLTGDRLAAARALANLVDNAMAYAPERSAIEIAVEVRGGDVLLAVSDRGPGVPAELHGRVFERFVRGPDAAALRPEGTGLGLALVRSVARGFGGEAEHEPRPGGGSVFRLRLPRGPAGEP